MNSSFTDSVMVYTENSNESTKKLQELASKYSGGHETQGQDTESGCPKLGKEFLHTIQKA